MTDQDSPALFALPVDTVHVWHGPFPTDAGLVERAAAALADDERARWSRFVDAPMRDRYALTRWFVRAILSGYTGLAAQALRFAKGAAGKPALDPPGDVEFSIAHTVETLIIGVRRTVPLGVDVERIVPFPDLLATARQIMADGEYRRFAALPPQARLTCFYQTWVQKEASVKADGTGITRDLRALTLCPEPLTMRPFGDTTLSPSRCAAVVIALQPAAGFTAAVVSAAPLVRAVGYALDAVPR